MAVVSSASPGGFLLLWRGLPSLGVGLENTLIEKEELESRTLVLLTHRSPPLSVCIAFAVGMESPVASDLINWEVQVEFPVMRQME